MLTNFNNNQLFKILQMKNKSTLKKMKYLQKTWMQIMEKQKSWNKNMKNVFAFRIRGIPIDSLHNVVNCQQKDIKMCVLHMRMRI